MPAVGWSDSLAEMRPTFCKTEPEFFWGGVTKKSHFQTSLELIGQEIKLLR